MEKLLLVTGVTLGMLAVIGLVWVWLTPSDNAPTPTVTPEDERRAADAAAAAGPSMYSRLGHGAIVAAVDHFYHRVLSDPLLKPYFDHLSPEGLTRLHQHQALLIGQVLGGPRHFEMDQLAEAHRSLQITHDAYWRTVGHLGAVLTGLQVPRDIVMHLLQTLYDVEALIVDEPAPAPVG